MRWAIVDGRDPPHGAPGGARDCDHLGRPAGAAWGFAVPQGDQGIGAGDQGIADQTVAAGAVARIEAATAHALEP